MWHRITVSWCLTSISILLGQKKKMLRGRVKEGVAQRVSIGLPDNTVSSALSFTLNILISMYPL